MQHIRASIILVVILFFGTFSAKSQLVINEIFLSNCSYDMDLSTYNYSNWVELHNTGTSSVNLISYYLSDDENLLNKWRIYGVSIPASGYKTFFLDGLKTGYHANFKANADGGTLYLSNAAGEIIDKVTYGKQQFNVSYGRYPNATGAFQFLLVPTRDAENSSLIAPDKSTNVIISHTGGFYTSAIQLSLTNTLGSGDIYYTTNGDEPGITSNKYTKTISLTANTVFRARIIETGKIPGNIITHTYFIGQRKPDLPVVSLVTPVKNLTDNTIGIYVKGTNGISGNCTNESNFNRDWERCFNFEYFDKNQEQKVNQMVGGKIAGGCSRNNPQKSLSITARSKYGKGRLNYAFFANRPVSDFNSIMLRNSGNDWGNTLFRDAMIQKLTDANMDLEHQETEPAVLFINGQYYGITSITERSGADLIEACYGLADTEIDMGEAEGYTIEGSAAEYGSLLSYVQNNSPANQSVYNYIANRIDISNFTDYYIAQMYSGNDDWPGNNCKYWRRNNPVGKWRYILFDTDFGFWLTNSGGYPAGPDKNMVHLVTNVNYGWPNYEWSTRIFRRLIENSNYRTFFLNRFYTHLNSTFTTQRVISVIDSMQANMMKEIPFHFTRWGGGNINDWNYRVELMREYARQRPDYMRRHLNEYFGLGNDVAVSCKSAQPGYGYITFDNVKTLDTAFYGIFPQNTIAKIGFVPGSGYKFVKVQRVTKDIQHLQFIKSGDIWKYNDKGPDVAADWKTNAFDDAAWDEGPSQLGYSPDEFDENTVIGYGPDANNKFITAYFRKSFEFDSLLNYDDILLRVLFDDGVVVYVNGVEALRLNMPEGPVEYSTLAITHIDPENVFMQHSINKNFFVSGTNTIAVEVHQNSPMSSDLSFDLELSATLLGAATNSVIINTPVFTDTLSSSIDYLAYFEPDVPVKNLVINEIAPLNSVYADEYGQKDDWFELFNNGPDSITLSGLYVTDSYINKYLFRIPMHNGQNVVLPPYEYVTLWADNQIKQGPLHVGFKLKAGGEQLGIYQKIGTNTLTLCEVTYAEVQKPYQSYGRFPDVTGSFKILARATPGAENVDEPLNVPDSPLYSDGFAKMFFEADSKLLHIWLNSNNNITPNLRVYDIFGRHIVSKKLHGNAEIVSLNSLKNGFYIVAIETLNGNYSQKIVVY